jgi:hypothetical protein
MLQVKCQSCGHVCQVRESRAGEFIDCVSCGDRLIVPDAADARATDDQYTFDNQPSDGEMLVLPSRRFWAWTFRILAGLAICALLVAVLVGRLARFVAGPVPWPVPVAKAGRPNPRPPARRLPPPRVPANQPRVLARNTLRTEPGGAPTSPVPWSLVPEPRGESISLGRNQTVHIPIPPGPNPEVVIPAVPSTMVAVGNVGHGRELREVWDFHANRKIGTTTGLRTLSENLEGFFRPLSMLSGDGRLFVTQGQRPFDFVVWDVVAEKQLRIVTVEHAPTASLTFATLAGPERMVVGGFGTPSQILGVAAPSTKMMRQFPRADQFDNHALAISPGGRFLAVYDKSALVLRFYDVERGTPAGQLTPPPWVPAGAIACECIAFSPDRREVAALFYYNSRSYLACWDLNGGRLVDRIDFHGHLRMILGAPLPYLFAPLEWFPDGKRWLLYGQGVVARGTGKVLSIIPDEIGRMRYGSRHVAGDDCVLSVVNEKGLFVLTSLPLPLQEN